MTKEEMMFLAKPVGPRFRFIIGGRATGKRIFSEFWNDKIFNNKNHIKMSITSGFRGKAAKKAHKILDNRYDSAEKAILKVEFEGREKALKALGQSYQKEKLQLMADIAAGKVKEEDVTKKVPAKKSVAKKAPVKKASPPRRKPKGESEESVDPLS